MKKMLLIALVLGFALVNGSALASTKSLDKVQKVETQALVEKSAVTVEPVDTISKDNKKPACSMDNRCLNKNIKHGAKEGGLKKHVHHDCPKCKGEHKEHGKGEHSH